MMEQEGPEAQEEDESDQAHETNEPAHAAVCRPSRCQSLSREQGVTSEL